MRWTPRLDKLEEAARRKREAARPSVIIVVPNTAAGHPRVDGKAIMLQSAADRLSDELTARGE